MQMLKNASKAQVTSGNRLKDDPVLSGRGSGGMTKDQHRFLTSPSSDHIISAPANTTRATPTAILDTTHALRELSKDGIRTHLSAKAEAIVRELKSPGPKNSGRKTAKIILFTDIGRDIDDAALLVLLAYLHKLEVVELLLVVANVKPSELRARTAKFVLENMGLPNVPVARGSDGGGDNEKLHHYEFEGVDEPRGAILGGETAVIEKLEALKENGERCNILVTTSLRDLSELLKRQESLIEATVSSFFFQGAWETDCERVKTLVPDMTAVNNSYDRKATADVFHWLRHGSISTYTSTKFPAIEAAVDSQVFCEAAGRGHAVARYIHRAFGKQEEHYYSDAADPKTRFRPHMDVEWYTNRHPRWREARGNTLPETFDDVLPFVDMTLYDVITGLLCSLQGYDFFEYLYQPHQQKIFTKGKNVDHYIVGRLVDSLGRAVSDVHAELLSSVIVELLREALKQPEQDDT